MRDSPTSSMMCPMCVTAPSLTTSDSHNIIVVSGLPSTRINLSPFTKDFRGGKQVNESLE